MNNQHKNKAYSSEYQIVPYSSEHLSQVARLMKYLWSNDIELNLKYFKWKHADNPCTEHPLGMVALHDGNVVGFRAYFALKYRIGEGNEFILLIPGDTVVHSKHRRKGLSVAMGRRATAEYESKYRAFLNFTSNANSLPGYINLGFFPLASKIPLVIFSKDKGLEDLMPSKLKKYARKYRRHGFNQLVSAIRKISTFRKEKSPFGEFGNIIVSDSPKPEEMYRVIIKQSQENKKIELLKDEDFFRWRFLNMNNKYIFYYYRSGGSITGYLVISIPPQKIQRGKILDYAQYDNEALEKILDYIIESGYPKTLSVLSFGLNENLIQALKRLNLYESVLSQKEKEHDSGELQLLVRPVKEKLDESDWFIDVMDIRNFENWEIMPICSDGE